MKLYRGCTKIPKFFISKLQKEYYSLENEAQKLPKNLSLVEFIKIFGSEKLIRLHELRKIAHSQFFTDNLEIAKQFADEKGFVVELDIDDVIAREHYQGEQVVTGNAKNSKPQYCSNFVFKGKELYEFAMSKRIEVKSISDFKNPELKKIEDLNPKDPAAIEEFREGRPPKRF